MIFRHYTHGHSIAVGALIGLLLDRHAFIIACAALAAGVAVGRSWAWLGTITRDARKRITRP